MDRSIPDFCNSKTNTITNILDTQTENIFDLGGGGGVGR